MKTVSTIGAKTVVTGSVHGDGACAGSPQPIMINPRARPPVRAARPRLPGPSRRQRLLAHERPRSHTTRRLDLPADVLAAVVVGTVRTLALTSADSRHRIPQRDIVCGNAARAASAFIAPLTASKESDEASVHHFRRDDSGVDAG